MAKTQEEILKENEELYGRFNKTGGITMDPTPEEKAEQSTEPEEYEELHLDKAGAEAFYKALTDANDKVTESGDKHY